MHSIRDLQNTWIKTVNTKEKRKCIHYIIRDFNEVPSATDKTSRENPARVENHAVLTLVAPSCLTLCNPMDCSPPGSSVHGDSPGKNTGVSCHALLQGIFPTQGSNSGLWSCRQILYHLSHQGRPCCMAWSKKETNKGRKKDPLEGLLRQDSVEEEKEA